MNQYPNNIKRFISVHIPVYACNFRCSYCYVGQFPGAYKNGIKSFCVSPRKISDFFSVERVGGYCYFNLCATGETMMHPQLIELVYYLTFQGHFVDIITNGTLTNKFEELMHVLDQKQKQHLFIKFSFHYLELKKRNLLETYLKNIKIVKDNNISYTIEVTPHDELIPYIDELKNFSIEKFGAFPHITVARNEATKEIKLLSKQTKEEYKKTWSVFDSALFDFKADIFNVRRNEFCYAGKWSLVVNLLSGEYRQCYCGKVLGNITNKNSPINFQAIGKCTLPHCFNGHAFLAWGNIPELKTPTYAQERDRKLLDNTYFLQDECQKFFSTKLYDNNEKYTEYEKKEFINNNTHKTFEKTNIQNKLIFLKNKVKKICKTKTPKIFYRLKLFFLIIERRKKNILLKKYFSEVLPKDEKVILLIGTGTYGNMGDQAITFAEMIFFAKVIPNSRIVKVNPEMLSFNCGKIIKKFSEQIDKIFITGGGFLGSIWLDNEKQVRSIVKHMTDKKIIVFPQSVFYEKKYLNEFLISKKNYQSHNSLCFFIRDASYDFVVKNIKENSSIEVFSIPDIVLSLNYSGNNINRKNILFCLRDDKEDVTNSFDILKLESALKKQGFNIVYTDTIIDEPVTDENREEKLKEKLLEFQSAKMVITNRLHGLIFSVITGTPCIALNNLSGKIKGVYDMWLKKLQYIRFLNSTTEIDTFLINEIISLKNNKYNPDMFAEYWKVLGDKIYES